MRPAPIVAPILALIIAALAMSGHAMAEALTASAVGPLVPSAPAEAELRSGTLTLSALGDGSYALRLDGVITPEVAARFNGLLDRLPAGAPLLLELRSPGGYTSAGYSMIDRVMAEREAGRPVSTRVGRGDYCESMCVGLFMVGETRVAAPDAEFMVHAPRGLTSGAVTVRSVQRMMDRLRQLGASEEWLRRVEAAGGFSGRVDYRVPAAQLAADRAGVVTALDRP